MKLNYNLDLDSRSYGLDNTPGGFGSRLPALIEGCGYFYANSGYFTERDGMDSYLLIHTLSGKGSLIWGSGENKTEVLLEPGCTIVFNCMEYQQYRTEGGFWEFYWAHINGLSIKEYADIINAEGPAPIPPNQDAEVPMHFQNLMALAKKRDLLFDVKASALLTSILAEMAVLRISTPNTRNYHQHRHEIHRVIDYIRLHYHENINMEDIASLVHISRFHFTRIFKSHTGQSPYEYLVTYRINASKHMLRETELPVQAVATACGFGDVSHYIRSFRESTGMTPQKFRKYRMG